MFASNVGLDLLLLHKQWFGDGTFKNVPSIFYQLYVIHVRWYETNKTIPVVYVLMNGKNKQDYLDVFAYLKVILI